MSDCDFGLLSAVSEIALGAIKCNCTRNIAKKSFKEIPSKKFHLQMFEFGLY